jgi:hypothetical protein
MEKDQELDAQINAMGNEDSMRAEISRNTQEFSNELTDLLVKSKDSVPLSAMAKVMLSASVDLILNQGALQTQYIVQKMLAPLFKGEGETSRIIIP